MCRSVLTDGSAAKPSPANTGMVEPADRRRSARICATIGEIVCIPDCSTTEYVGVALDLRSRHHGADRARSVGELGSRITQTRDDRHGQRRRHRNGVEQRLAHRPGRREILGGNPQRQQHRTLARVHQRPATIANQPHVGAEAQQHTIGLIEHPPTIRQVRLAVDHRHRDRLRCPRAERLGHRVADQPRRLLTVRSRS